MVAALLTACATRPPAPADRDGPDPNPPAGLERTPDAVPRVEPIRTGGPNRPYEVLGRRYEPHTGDVALVERGLASWYGRKFHGRPTALGETYDMHAMTAAHKTMPLPSYARVRNPANGREIIVRVNDRGPFAPGRVIDLSYTAALRLGVLGGVAPVEVRRITHDEIRRGRWDEAASAAVPAPVAAGGSTSAPLPPDDPPDNAVATAAAGAGSPILAGGGFWLQVGAFRQRDGALVLRDRLLREAGARMPNPVPSVLLREESGLVRVHAGPYATRDEAQAAADALRSLLGVQPLVLEGR